MKTIITVLIAGVALASCSKEEALVPENQVETVTYTVKCEDCLITLTSDKWNERNELDRSKNQSFNVTGEFTYSFDNTTSLDSAHAIVSVSALYPKAQKVELSITNGKDIKRMVGKLGYSPGLNGENYPFEVSLTLNLK